MNQKFIENLLMGGKLIHSMFLAGLLFSLLTFGNYYAHATGFNQAIDQSGPVVSSNQFYDMLNHTKPKEVALTFGTPDKIARLEDFEGKVTGVIWTYQNAVSQKNEIMDANFVLVDGEFKYVTLTKTS